LFGPFTLSVSSRLLSRDGKPVQIGSRSLDILIFLLERAGEVVSKRDLLERVWPGLTVDEGGLRVHINGLRKALADGHEGARYVANVPGRGYSFVAPIVRERELPSVPARVEAAQLASLPPVLARMVGREDDVQSLAAQILELRFVSLVGPGGIGKTTVAIKACHQLRDEFAGNIRFINLSVITDPGLVQVTIASMLGVTANFSDPVVGIVALLRRQRCLLVLDSCEHLIDPVAALADAIRQQAPEAYLLTTTREALRVEGEHVVQLSTLACPPEGSVLTAAESLAYPAVELFAERASASGAGFKLTDDDTSIVADICRKLDGVALAIELGAGRVGAYGLAGTAQLLGSRLGLLWQGRRTAPARHQTLHATLDWSHDLLSAPRRRFSRAWRFSRDPSRSKRWKPSPVTPMTLSSMS
jgi:DNA-binding winged helix-turn-helix (wHTH) protein